MSTEQNQLNLKADADRWAKLERLDSLNSESLVRKALLPEAGGRMEILIYILMVVAIVNALTGFWGIIKAGDLLALTAEARTTVSLLTLLSGTTLLVSCLAFSVSLAQRRTQKQIQAIVELLKRSQTE